MRGIGNGREPFEDLDTLELAGVFQTLGDRIGQVRSERRADLDARQVPHLGVRRQHVALHPDVGDDLRSLSEQDEEREGEHVSAFEARGRRQGWSPST